MGVGFTKICHLVDIYHNYDEVKSLLRWGSFAVRTVDVVKIVVVVRIYLAVDIGFMHDVVNKSLPNTPWGYRLVCCCSFCCSCCCWQCHCCVTTNCCPLYYLLVVVNECSFTLHAPSPSSTPLCKRQNNFCFLLKSFPIYYKLSIWKPYWDILTFSDYQDLIKWFSGSEVKVARQAHRIRYSQPFSWLFQA